MDSQKLSRPVARSLPDLPNELLFMIADILGHDFSTLASLAATCRELKPFFNRMLYRLDAKSGNPTALAWGALTGNIKCMKNAMEQGTHVDQISRFSFRSGQPKSHFERELDSHSCRLHPSDPSTFTRHSEVPGSREKILWGTALHFAAVTNQVAAAELLIKAGAGFRERSFGLCSMSGHGEACAHSLESCPKEFFPMHTAVCYGNRDIIKLFLRRGAYAFYIADSMEDASDDPDDGLPEDGEELEPLQGVEEEEPPENPEWFQLGPDEPDDDHPGTPHATALHIAASLGRIDLVEFFAGKNGIFMNATDCDGRNPLHYAAHAMLKHPRAVIRKLVQMGARLDAQNDIDFELIVRSVAEGRCAVAVDLLHLRAYTHLTTEQLGYLLHAALTPAALYSFERGISIANLSSASYSRHSVLLPKSHRGSYNTGYPDSTSDSDIDSLERQELVRLLVKEFGVDVNRILPSIPETPATLLALCNASSSGMLRCLLDLGADITKINGNGDTAIHYAMKLSAREWKTLEPMREYKLEPWNDWEETGVGRSPGSVLRSLLAAWPGDKFNAVDKDGIDILQCIFDSISWEERRYIDLANILNRRPLAGYEGIIPVRTPQIVGFIEKTMRLQFVESLFSARSTDDINWGWGWSQEKEEIRKTVIAKLTEIRRKLKMASEEKVLMGTFHTYPNFSGKKSGRPPVW